MAADAVQARKDIRAMGLEFTGSAFATVAGNDDLMAVQLFLDAGMDMNAGGGAAIGVAAGRGKARMVQFLLSKGEKPTANALLPGDCQDTDRCRGAGVIRTMLIAVRRSESH